MRSKIIIRNATQKDLAEVLKLENEIWPEGTRAPLEKFESRLRVFPEGFFIAYENRKLIGVSTSQIINYNESDPPTSWEQVTDEGWIIQTHRRSGNALYVVSLGSISRSGGGTALLQAQKDLTTKLNLAYLVLGSRIPGYDAYCNENGNISVEDYVRLKNENGELLDPELRFYIRNGLNLIRVVPNYMEEDKESRDYGAIMIWRGKTPSTSKPL